MSEDHKCERRIDKGLRYQGHVVPEPCGKPAVVHEPSKLNPVYSFHYCEEHRTK